MKVVDAAALVLLLSTLAVVGQDASYSDALDITSENNVEAKDDGRDSRVRRWRTACPRHCVCVADNVFCDGVNLRSFPRQIQRDVKSIYMRDNHIRRLQTRRLRGLIDLRHLLLKGNRIIEIEADALSDLKRLVSLSLTDNNLQSLPPGVFDSLTGLKVISIRNNKLRQVEDQFSTLPALQLINLANNRIKTLSENAFKGTVNLRVLDLHKNKLNYIAPSAFANTPKLKYLVLRDNPLRQVTLDFHPAVRLQLLDASHCLLGSVLQGLPSVVDDLRLNNNNIRQVLEDDFKNVRKVRLLVLNNNKISHIHQKALTRLDELYDLYVGKNALNEMPRVPSSIHGLYANYNNISRLYEGMFPFTTRLEFVFLRHNQIAEIEDTAFHGLRYMRSLDLSRNKIMALKRFTFYDLNRLELLDLTKNPLEELEDGCFQGLRGLSILQMSSVATKTPNIPATFSDLHQVLFLDLSNSSTLVENLARNSFDMPPFASVQDLNLMDDHLHMLPPDFPNHFPQLRVIKLLGNPWHCNKTILWLVDWIRNSSVEFFASNYMTCATPPELKGRALQSLQPAEVPYESPYDDIPFDDLIFEIIDSHTREHNPHLTRRLQQHDQHSSNDIPVSALTLTNNAGDVIHQQRLPHNSKLDPYGHIVRGGKAPPPPLELRKKPTDEKLQNSVIKDTPRNDVTGGNVATTNNNHNNNALTHDAQQETVMTTEQKRIDADRMRELREGSTFDEVSRKASAVSMFDDSSGFVDSDEFIIV